MIISYFPSVNMNVKFYSHYLTKAIKDIIM